MRHTSPEDNGAILNMDVIGVVAQKGGVGKTHLAINWAVEAERQGMGPVAVLDLDPQATAVSWSQRRLRKMEVNRPFILKAEVDDVGSVSLKQVVEVCRACRDEGIELLFIDTPPSVRQPVLVTMEVSDYVVIPSGPSLAEMEAIGTTVAIVRSAGVPGCIVVNRGRPRSPVNEDASTALAGYELPVCPLIITQRAAIQDGFRDGQTGREYAPRGKAGGEITESWQWITEQIKGVG